MVALNGFLLGFSLILAIGAQNAFVLRIGLEGRHVFAICLFCALSDMALIIVGVAGTGNLLARAEGLVFWLYLVAALWLAVYGLLRLRDAISGQSSLKASEAGGNGLGANLLVAAGLTWLNPHVYLDTVVLLGGISATLAPTERPLFAIGAGLASLVFFFGLGYGARALGSKLTSSKTWARLDLGIAAVMFWLAGGLIWAALTS